MSGPAERSTLALALAALVVAFTASTGTAAASSRGSILGLVPHAGVTHSLASAVPFAVTSFLTFDANYEALINQYLTDVAHDSGGTSNVYSIATQYSDGSGPIQYQSTFGGSYVDHDPLPANGCDDGQDAVCLSDPQFLSEIQNVLTAKGWHGGTSTMFVLLTPNGVGSCLDGTNRECTTNTYCAYHNDFIASNGQPVIYANEPYNATITGCNSGTSPNGDDADAAINTISHEHNEAITDPFGDAWWRDSDHQENGDLCAWTFGTPIGGVGVGQYNQLINGHHYWLQEEYSNQGSRCYQDATQEGPAHGSELTYHGGLVMHTNTTYAIYWLPTLRNAAPPVITGTAAVNRTLTSSNGSWSGSPTGYAYQWQRCASANAGCTNIPNAAGSTYTLTTADGGHYVRSTVSSENVNGFSPYAASAGVFVVPLPATTGAPVLSGAAAVGKKLTTTVGAWNTQASFAYQWLRCAADGTGCTSIAGARSASHAAVAADVGHRLEALVLATNLVGTAEALSGLSGVVVAVPHAKRAPRISGRAHIARRFFASPGSWSGPPNRYRYQWLRCNTRGRFCVSIRGATRARYRLMKRDAGHRLRVRVTATNAAGSRAAASRASAPVSR
jgi:hypothetical protein